MPQKTGPAARGGARRVGGRALMVGAARRGAAARRVYTRGGLGVGGALVRGRLGRPAVGGVHGGASAGGRRLQALGARFVVGGWGAARGRCWGGARNAGSRRAWFIFVARALGLRLFLLARRWLGGRGQWVALQRLEFRRQRL
jgi:hypothetical protein